MKIEDKIGTDAIKSSTDSMLSNNVKELLDDKMDALQSSGLDEITDSNTSIFTTLKGLIGKYLPLFTISISIIEQNAEQFSEFLSEFGDEDDIPEDLKD